MKRISSIIILGTLVLPQWVFAQDDFFGLTETAGKAGLDTSQTNVAVIIGEVVGTALSLIGVAFFLLMIVAGLRWMFARGNQDAADKALNTIISAIIGILITLGSYAIITFIFNIYKASPTPTAPVEQPSTPQAQTCTSFSLESQCQAAPANLNCIWEPAGDPLGSCKKAE